jgi:group I intron endonuclease
MDMWHTMPRESGIYLIRNTVSGKVYVGSALCLRKRVVEHRRLLRAGKHRNPALQASWVKHGEGAFSIEALEICASEDATLLAAEQRHMDDLAKGASLYNACPVAGTRRGAKMPPEAVAKIADQKRGNAYRLGAVIPQEMRERIAEKLRGRKANPETKAKLSRARRGKPKSDEWKRKISEIHRGREISVEQRAKIAAKLKGRKIPAEVLAKRLATIAARKKEAQDARLHHPPLQDR